MKHCKQHWMLNTPIFRLIMSSSLPIMPAVFLIVAYDLLETGLIARLCANHLAALSFSAPVTTGMTGIAIAISIATNNWICRIKSDVNQNSCSEEKQALNQNVLRAIVIATSLTLALSVALYLLSPTLYQLIGTKTGAQPTIELGMSSLVIEYTNIRLLGWIALVLIWQINGILRSYGYIKQASIILISWMLSKMVLSYFLIGNGECSQFSISGIIGAGYAHIIADTVFVIISFAVLFNDLGIQKQKLPVIYWKKTVEHMSVTGINATLQQLFLPLAIGLLTFYMTTLDEDKVALLSIIFRVEALGVFVPMVFTASLPGLIAANWWAGHIDRVKKLILQGFLIIASVQSLIALVLYFYAQSIAAEITQSDSLQPFIEQYLVYVPISFIGAGCSMLALSCLNAIGKSSDASTLGFAHKVLLTLSFAVIGGEVASITGVFIGIALAHLVSILLVLKYLSKSIWRGKIHMPPTICSFASGSSVAK